MVYAEVSEQRITVDEIGSDIDVNRLISERAGLPSILPDADRETWNGLTAAQRSRALERISIIADWEAGRIGMEEVERLTNRSRSHFYRMAAAFRAAPSLGVLGIFAEKGGRKPKMDSETVNALQGVVADIVAIHEDASVSQLVRLMIGAAGVSAKKLPGMPKLRAIVEAEQRRVAATADAGHALRFDCVATNLPHADGRPYIAFVCLDEGTRLVLGAAIAKEPLTAGYAPAARDASERVARSAGRLPWALRTARIELVAGADREASIELHRALITGGVRSSVQLAQAPRRYGRYFRQIVGDRLGRVRITPNRTERGQAIPDNGDMTAWSLEEASEALLAGMTAHNEQILSVLQRTEARRVPDDLPLALEIIGKL